MDRGFTYEGTKTVTQIEGAATAACADDVYSTRSEYNHQICQWYNCNQEQWKHH